MNNQNEIKITNTVTREHKIISMDDGSVTLVTKLNDGTAHIFESISMQKALDYIACYESLELVRIGA